MKKRTAYTKKVQPLVTLTSTQPLPPATPSSKWYQNIYELPLSRFEECIVNNNIAALTISGFPSQEDLSKAWESIMQEYSECIGNQEYNMYVELYRAVEILRIDYESVNILVAALRKNYWPYFCSELNTLLRTNCKFNIEDPSSYFADLDKCERRNKAWKIQLDLRRIELESVKKKVMGDETGQKVIDKNYFTSILISLSKHNTYRITKDIFVNEYCEHIKQYNAYFEELSKSAKK